MHALGASDISATPAATEITPAPATAASITEVSLMCDGMMHCMVSQQAIRCTEKCRPLWICFSGQAASRLLLGIDMCT